MRKAHKHKRSIHVVSIPICEHRPQTFGLEYRIVPRSFTRDRLLKCARASPMATRIAQLFQKETAKALQNRRDALRCQDERGAPRKTQKHKTTNLTPYACLRVLIPNCPSAIHHKRIACSKTESNTMTRAAPLWAPRAKPSKIKHQLRKHING